MAFKILFIGCGDIAQRAAICLGSDDYQFAGLRRQVQSLPEAIEPLALDLDREQNLVSGLGGGFDVVVITLSPGERNEEAYRRCYVDNLRKIISGLEQAERLPLVLFVSSTSVYAHNGGEWVDERSITEPERFNGRSLLQAERLLGTSALPHCILRFSGIYGPGRGRLIDQVKNGQWSQAEASLWSNRIHADDGAAFIAHLIEKVRKAKTIKPLYLVSDSEPALHYQVKIWLARQTKQVFPEYESNISESRGKRCNNADMLASGFRLKYANYRDGYARLLENY